MMNGEGEGIYDILVKYSDDFIYIYIYVYMYISA